MPTVLWFRRDLRLADHPALCEAAAAGEVVGLFVVDPFLVARSGAARLAHLAASVRALRHATGGALAVVAGDPHDVVPDVAAEVGADEVLVSADAGPYGRRRDAAVGERLAAAGRRLRAAGSPYAVPPGRVVKDDGTPYAVFTPFSRAWLRIGWEAPLPAPAVSWRPVARPDDLARLEGAEPGADLPPAGEAAAHDRLDAFVTGGGLDRYAESRNRPDLDATSHLSVHLRWGELHPRQVLARLGDDASHRVFRSELCWREFYADVLARAPGTVSENLDRRMDRLPVDTDARARERFAAWGEGRTGYPIVDAGMRQLQATGWMHNRVRMITASFLVKDLHLPWQWGARHFMQHLVDGDLASNTHGWQWTAGTGTDAAPYFRIFNPVAQGERFDPDGVYVRRWVPELAHVADRHVHAPWADTAGLPLGALAPIVDHGAERAESLRRYALVKA